MGARGRVLVALLAVSTAVLAGCANIPEQSTPQVVGKLGTQAPGATPLPDPKTDPYTLVRNFVGEGGNPEAAKGYLTDAAKPNWRGDGPPTIVDETFRAAPIPPQERKAQGEDGGNDVTVVLTVTKLGRLGLDRAFVPDIGTAEYRVLVHRDRTDDPWRIQTPPDTVLITLPTFNLAYQRVSVYYFDPELRVTVPDLRYIPAQPLVGAPDRVMRLLLDGPSDILNNAVKTALPLETEMRTNAVSDADGALVVNLTKLGDRTPDERQLIAAQVVLSLKDVVQTKIRLLADGHALIGGHSDWRPSDLPSYDLPTRPNPDLPGMFTAPTRRVYSLRDGAPIAGPAGNGEVPVASAAQSIDGKNLAVVQEVSTGARLRIGGIGGALREVDMAASTLTRPTWLLSAPNAASNEVWTVQNGVDVVRVVRTGNDTWAPSPVIVSELRSFGSPITELRLSRDGVRVAAVIGGQVVVASVVRAKDTVSLHAPRTLRTGELTSVVDVDWLNQDTLVVGTAQPNRPVFNVPVDGFDLSPYNSSNLGTPITAIAAAPDRPILVTDTRDMWEASEIRQIWRLHATQVPGARPFYPG